MTGVIRSFLISRNKSPPSNQAKQHSWGREWGRHFQTYDYFLKGGADMARQKQTIRNQVISNMRELGVYSKEYRTTIDIFVDMVHQYEVFSKQFEEEGYSVQEEYTNKAGATNMRKTPTYAAMEKLRMDISTYSNLLCLNPKSLGLVNVNAQSESKLASVLSKLE